LDWWPAIGGVFVGLGGLIRPARAGVGTTSSRPPRRQLVGTTLVVLLVVKALIWGRIGSLGYVGGLVAPLLLMGSALGALGATVFHAADATLW